MTWSRRTFMQAGTLAAAAARFGQAQGRLAGIEEFGYGDVTLGERTLQEKQFRQTQGVLRGLDEEGLLKPFRLRAGLAAPGPDLGGWYDYRDPTAESDGRGGGVGFCTGHTFGQWLSSFARAYAVDRDPAVRAKMVRLLDGYGAAISGKFYENFRFPAYVYEKLNVGLLDAYRYGNIPQAKELFRRTAAAAGPYLPPRPLNRDEQRAWRIANGDRATEDFCWDESYTLPENLFLATRAGMGDYRALAGKYLLDGSWFDPLARGENVLDGHHAYSYCNSLNSGMQAYFDGGDEKYLRAAVNGVRMIAEQSFATGGWGPQEGFGKPGREKLYTSLGKTHSSFETPCGSYAQFKITRALLRVTGDAAYGDSMERVMVNTVLGAKALEANGNSFYYADFGMQGQKAYFKDAWPCCSGTIGQVTADYRVSTYFRDGRGLFVNLYVPSRVRFVAPDGAEGLLSQDGDYPFGNTARFRMEMRRGSTFAVRFRVPGWATGAEFKVNGLPVKPAVRQGWATVGRRWRDGDRVEIRLGMEMRLEAIDAAHPEIVALMRGALVLFALGTDVPSFARRELLEAKMVGAGVWMAGGTEMRPFTGIGDEVYRTYQTVTA